MSVEATGFDKNRKKMILSDVLEGTWPVSHIHVCMEGATAGDICQIDDRNGEVPVGYTVANEEHYDRIIPVNNNVTDLTVTILDTVNAFIIVHLKGEYDLTRYV
jgi:hypothetical protein